MAKKNYSLWKTAFILGASVISIEAFNRLVFSWKGKEEPLYQNGHYLDWKHGSIFYRKQEGGSGRPVLLLHDLYPDQSEESLQKIAVQLAEKRTVYSMDLLGCGHSEKPALTYTNFLYVMQVTELIEKVIQQPVHLVAKGRSAAIAIAATRYKPEYISQITLLDPADIRKNKKTPDPLSKLKKRLIELPILGTLVYNIAFFNSKEAHLGGTTARFLYASIVGRYTEYDVEWMLNQNDVPLHIIKTAE